jgi:hypothetical protein
MQDIFSIINYHIILLELTDWDLLNRPWMLIIIITVIITVHAYMKFYELF